MANTHRVTLLLATCVVGSLLFVSAGCDFNNWIGEGKKEEVPE